MSGILGGTGSKSGVISQTELDYEEGTWTPTNSNSVSYHSYTKGRYVKIGKTVRCTVHIKLNNSGGNSVGDWGGLPFPTTTLQADSAWGVGGGLVTYCSDTVNPRSIQIQIRNNNKFKLIDGYLTLILRQNKQLVCSFEYQTSN